MSLMLATLPEQQKIEEFAKVLGFRSEQPWLKSAQTVKFADLGNSHLQEFAKVVGKREG